MRKMRGLILVLLAAVAATWMAAAVAPSEDAAKDEWTAPARAARKKNPVAADEASIAAGKALYVRECLQCHGPTGKGDGPAAKDLTEKPHNLSEPKIASQSDGSLFWKITEGKKPMPGYEKLLNETERWQVVVYVRTLAPAPGK